MKNKYLSFLSAWSFIYQKSRLLFFSTIFIILLCAFSELITLAFIYPVIRFITDSSIKEEPIKYLNFLDLNLGSLTLVAVIAIFLSGLIRFFSIIFFNLMASKVASDTGLRIFKSKLNYETTPYQEKFKASDLIQSVRDYPVEMSVKNIVPGIQIPQSIIVVLSMLIYVIFKAKLISFILFIAIVISYLFIFIFVQPYIYKLGKRFDNLNRLLAANLNNISEGWRDIFTFSLLNKFTNQYSKDIYKLLTYRAIILCASGTPKILIESLLLGSALLSFYFNKGSETLAGLSLTIFAVLKMLPYIQTLYGAYSQISSWKYSLNRIDEELNYKNSKTKKPFYPSNLDSNIVFKLNDNAQIQVSLKSKLTINENFNYEKNSDPTNNYLVIDQGKKVFITGPSGSGKSQLLDLISGFYVSNQNYNIKYSENLQNKHNIGLTSYSAQRPVLFRGSIKENIVLNSNKEYKEDKYNKIISALSLEVLTNSSKTFDPEIDILSGGESKRISIARALYMENNPILVLDEPTGELDDFTSRKFLSELPNLLYGRTLVLVTHNVVIPSWCDFHIKFY
ncbi:MAG: ABC transporter ATP-binding protein/permease [Prochlorococcus marinus CUG1437]|nr:ABC transporter ATP-binding protein/permease [Prochlorococcus marinus CUG1437]